MIITLAMASKALTDINAIDAADYPDEMAAAYELVESWVGEGGKCRPELEQDSHDCRSDYICALEDGSFLAWGADRANGDRDVIHHYAPGAYSNRI